MKKDRKPIRLAEAARNRKKRDKKIIYVLESSGLTGGVRTILDQANLLYHHGWDVGFLSGDTPPKWYDVDRGIRWETFATYAEIVSALKMEERALKVATWWKTAYVVKQGSIGPDGLYYIQDIESHYYNNYQQQRQVAESYNLGLHHYTNSTFVMDAMGQSDKPCVYTGLWFPTPSTYTVDPNANPYILSTQRRQHIKGFTTLAEFARRWFTLQPRTGLMTYSTEPPTKLAANHFHIQAPPDKDVEKLFANARAYVCPSNHEGTGMPIIQAMMHRVPVATTACGGNEKFCLDGETALVVPAGDAAGLAAATNRLLTDHELVYKISRNAYALTTEMFSQALWRNRILQFFDERWKEMS